MATEARKCLRTCPRVSTDVSKIVCRCVQGCRPVDVSKAVCGRLSVEVPKSVRGSVQNCPWMCPRLSVDLSKAVPSHSCALSPLCFLALALFHFLTLVPSCLCAFSPLHPLALTPCCCPFKLTLFTLVPSC